MVTTHPRLRSRAFSSIRSLFPFAILWMVVGCAGSNPLGDRWALEVVDLPVSVSLRGIAALSPSTVWVSGSNGTVARSLDGGESWSLVGPSGTETLDFRSLWVFDTDTAIVASAGSPGRVFRTEDGGNQWQLVHADDRAEIFFDGMVFDDRGRGVLVGDPIEGRFVLLRSDDRGRHWHQSSRAPAAEREEALFAASNSSLAFGAHGLMLATSHSARVLRSDRDLVQWQWSRVPLAKGAASKGIFAIGFAAGGLGCAVGGDYTNADEREGTAAFTVDGGRTWHQAERMPSGFRSALAIVPAFGPGLRLAAGTNGIDISRDGGRRWYRLHDRGHHALAVARDGSAVVFAAGADGRVSRIRPN